MISETRWRHGDLNTVVAAVKADTVIHIGDLLWQDVDNARPASDLPYRKSFRARSGGTIAATMEPQMYAYGQQMFADKFLGVAMQRSGKEYADLIRVATTGVFEFDCPREIMGKTTDPFELGDLVGMEIIISAIMSQKVVKVAVSKCAIGRVARREPSEATSVLVAIQSTVMTGGIMLREG